MLEAACDRARSVALDLVFFSLDADKYRQFTTFLNAPPTPNPGLVRLMAVQARGPEMKKPQQEMVPMLRLNRTAPGTFRTGTRSRT